MKVLVYQAGCVYSVQNLPLARLPVAAVPGVRIPLARNTEIVFCIVDVHGESLRNLNATAAGDVLCPHAFVVYLVESYVEVCEFLLTFFRMRESLYVHTRARASRFRKQSICTVRI